MNDQDRLREASVDEIAESLAFSLRFDGKRRIHDADATMAMITAERLVRHLQRSGFVILKKPALAAHKAWGPGEG
jgi:hypothetical protein